MISGSCPDEVAQAKPPPAHDARWLNDFSSLLRLHLSTKPGPKRVKMLRMVQYIVKVYGPSWLLAKWNWQFKDGPHNFLRLTMLQKQHCSKEELAIVEKKLHINFFWAHEENVLTSMLSSNVKEEREEAVDVITNIRLRLDFSFYITIIK